MTKCFLGGTVNIASPRSLFDTENIAKVFWLPVTIQRSLKPSDPEGSLSENTLCHMCSMAQCDNPVCDSLQIPYFLCASVPPIAKSETMPFSKHYKED